MTESEYDVGIVGAGAAGMMTAVQCARAGLKVLLLEGQKTPGAKILMSGGTRCNLTNRDIHERDFNSENIRMVRNLLRAYTSRDAVNFFEGIGVGAVLEEQGKYFPTTHSGRTVLEAFLREIRRLGVDFRCGVRVRDITPRENHFAVSAPAFQSRIRAAVICTGGLSYPSTGSDGTGYQMAKKFGHTLIKTSPALTPFLTQDPSWKALSGIAFPARLILSRGGEKIHAVQGSFLITHFGFSGPAALDMSRHWLHHRQDSQVRVLLDSAPALTENEIRSGLAEARRMHSVRSMKAFLSGYLPIRLGEKLVRDGGADPLKRLSDVSNIVLERVLRAVKTCILPISDVYGYQKAEATAGGVALSELHPVTLESLKIPGLYFAGEVLDVDGRIGGFNFHWAWASAVAVSRGIHKRLLDRI